jgi:hypothetical protein
MPTGERIRKDVAVKNGAMISGMAQTVPRRPLKSGCAQSPKHVWVLIDVKKKEEIVLTEDNLIFNRSSPRKRLRIFFINKLDRKQTLSIPSPQSAVPLIVHGLSACFSLKMFCHFPQRSSLYRQVVIFAFYWTEKYRYYIMRITT